MIDIFDMVNNQAFTMATFFFKFYNFVSQKWKILVLNEKENPYKASPFDNSICKPLLNKEIVWKKKLEQSSLKMVKTLLR